MYIARAAGTVATTYCAGNVSSNGRHVLFLHYKDKLMEKRSVGGMEQTEYPQKNTRLYIHDDADDDATHTHTHSPSRHQLSLSIVCALTLD